jgi:hypothetical protein
MRIRFTKLTDERHSLEIVRVDGSRECVECETRSYLMHDLLHYAVESEAELRHGFWGLLASGKTLADMNDRTGRAMAAEAPGLLVIEQVVGALSNVTKPTARPSREILAMLRGYSVAQEREAPAWLTEALIDSVRQRMRALVGHWNATRYREHMDLPWRILLL